MTEPKNYAGAIQGNLVLFDQKEFLLKLNSQKSNLLELVSAESFLPPHQMDLFKGKYLFGLVNKKFTIGIRDLIISQDFTTTAFTENMISIEYVLDGGSNMLLGEKNIYSNSMPKIYISSHKEMSQQTRFHQQNEKIKSVGIWIKPTTLMQDFGIDLTLLPAGIQGLLRLEQNLTAIIPIVAKIKTILNEIFEHPFSGKLANQFLSAKFTELLCQTVFCLPSPELTYQTNNHLSNKKSAAMAKLLTIVDTGFSQHLVLEDLAKQLSMSLNSMINTFKESYGLSITQYILQKRMEKALSLISSGKFSILEVAIEVGYNDQSSFGRAYKRFFNHSPISDKPK